MSAILGILLPLLSSIPGKLGDYFKGQQEIETLKQKGRIELEKENIALSKEMAKAKLEFQKESLKSTGKGFKYFTFAMWFGPYIIQIIYPPLGAQIFNNMLGMPEWYAQSCVAIMFTVWGLSVSSPVISSIFSSLGNYFQQRRGYKIEKAKVDRKAFYEALRAIFPKGYTQEQVDKINKALDEGEK